MSAAGREGKKKRREKDNKVRRITFSDVISETFIDAHFSPANLFDISLFVANPANPDFDEKTLFDEGISEFNASPSPDYHIRHYSA